MGEIATDVQVEVNREFNFASRNQEKIVEANEVLTVSGVEPLSEASIVQLRSNNETYKMYLFRLKEEIGKGTFKLLD